MAFLPHILLLVPFLFVLIADVHSYADKLLMVSMDGFRWDYVNSVDTPNFDRMKQEGVKLEYMNNAFITKTFPNHYTLATGLYEESHGIIGNKMYDPVFDETFNAGKKDTKWWDMGEPIWITAVKNDVRAGVYYWVGSETEIQGYRPTFWEPYSDTTPFQERIDTVMDWFVNETVRLSLLYFPEPDWTGHLYGPDSPEIKAKVKEMDGWLGKIITGLESNGLKNSVNLIVLSDHGMTSINYTSRLIELYDYINKSDIYGVYDKGPIANIRPHDDTLEKVYNDLKDAHPNMTVYKKEDIPEHFHYKNNRRVMPIFVMADEGWYIVKERADLKNETEWGAHGYDNTLMSMKPIFYARGPDFKAGYSGQHINNVDVYPLICELMGFPPAPNNGSLEHTKAFLKSSDDTDAATSICTNIMTLALGLIFSSALGLR